MLTVIFFPEWSLLILKMLIVLMVMRIKKVIKFTILGK